MASIDDQELFEKYYQAEYDFNTSSLTKDEIEDIKKLVREKRVNYALAPIGSKIFEWVKGQEPDIHFEFVDFQSEKIDGMLYIPESGSDKAYIILNSNKPLINQIFTTAHEYYHYVKDYVKIKEEPYICDFSNLMNINEKRASRFAAEFLLPEEALREEIRVHHERLKRTGGSASSFAEYAVIAILLTIKYELPLKAVIYRLYEEKYIDNVKLYIENYDFIKNFLQEMKFFGKKVEQLYSKENPCFDESDMIYRQMRNAYLAGYAAREEILADAGEIGLDMAMVSGFFEQIEEDEIEDDQEMLAFLGRLWEEKQ